MPPILLRQRHPLVGILGTGYPGLSREHKQPNCSIPSPPLLLAHNLLPQFCRAELQCWPAEPRCARLGTLCPCTLCHPIDRLALMIEHCQQPPHSASSRNADPRLTVNTSAYSLAGTLRYSKMRSLISFSTVPGSAPP
nr:unnamed protein product [Digitaria exilis]